MKTMWLYLTLLSASVVTIAQQPASNSAEGQIVVWRVGSPYVGDTPDTTAPLDLKLKAEELGSPMHIESFPAKGFAQVFFDAIEAHHEPDIITFDNAGILNGCSTPLGSFTGIGSSPKVREALIQVTGSLKELTGGLGGWQYLVSTSKNYEVGRKLALRPPTCDPRLPSNTVPADNQRFAKGISKLYLQQSSSLRDYEDSQRLIAGGVQRDPLQVSETETCGYWGNSRLRFVSLISTYETAKVIGQIPVLLILRKPNSEWKLLAASTDPISTFTFLQQIPSFSAMLQDNSSGTVELLPASLMPLNGRAPVPTTGQQYGEFTWQPSPSDNVVAEIAEFAYQNDARFVLRLRQNIAASDEVSEGQLWHTASKWQWRIWSISNNGDVVFSQAESFPH
jgi:hypothetical protein